ncbi:MAG: hypothetical protein CMK59_09365, partial [Proteobacteria bacterium]|nr:hypothetical protein [Pseudomonadota bacterium]
GYDPTNKDELLNYGSYRSAVGDLNGDGYPDVVFGGYLSGTQSSHSYEASATIYFGGSGGLGSQGVSTLPSHGNWGGAVIVGAFE